MKKTVSLAFMIIVTFSFMKGKQLGDHEFNMLKLKVKLAEMENNTRPDGALTQQANEAKDYKYAQNIAKLNRTLQKQLHIFS